MTLATGAPATILVLGATSEVGRSSCLRLARDGRSIHGWSADAPASRRLLGADVLVHSAGETSLASLLERCDAVLDLSPLGPRRSDAALAGAELAAAWLRCGNPPATLVTVTRGGDDAAHARAVDSIRRRGARVVILSAATILDPEEGLLRSLLHLGALGAGRAPTDLAEPIAWIHRDDLVECAVAALDDTRLEGAIGAAAPEPVAPPALALGVARASGRDERALRAPAPKLLWPRDAPPRESDRGTPFSLAHSRLDEALGDLLAPGCTVGPATTAVDAEYVSRRAPLRELRSHVTLDAPLDVVFPFFSRPENLCALTPRGLGFRIVRRPAGGIAEGALIDYLISLGGLPMPWRTRIDHWEPPHRFADSQLFGPYRCWWHEHRFRASGKGTAMDDMVLFAPLGGRLAQPLAGPFVERMLRRIFSFRARGMRLRFGALG